jgi:hypothetical protein
LPYKLRYHGVAVHAGEAETLAAEGIEGACVSFVLTHFDAILTIILCGALLVFSGRMAVSNPNRQLLIRIGASVAILCSVALMLAPTANSSHVQATEDGVAEVTFPGKPTKSSVSVTPGVERTTYAYNPQDRDRAFSLSQLPVTGEFLTMSDSQRIDQIVAFFAAQGSVVSNRTTLSKNGLSLHCFQVAQGDATIFMRIAYVGTQSYRVTATIVGEDGVPSETTAFLESFALHPRARAGSSGRG